MIYGDTIIENLIRDGYIKHTYEGAVNPASINLRLGNTFLSMDSEEPIELGGEISYSRVGIEDHERIYLPPHSFILATTKEEVDIPTSCAAFVQGRSSIGRAGLSVQNAGFVDPGFKGHITLELKNETDHQIILRPGYPVAQLIFIEAYDVSHPYDGKYVGQVEATGSRMQDDIYKPGNQVEV